jgi:hypothetical protein
VAVCNPQLLVQVIEVAQGINAMIIVLHTTARAHISSRWIFAPLFLLFSLVVPAENSARLDILPTDDDDHLTDEIYNSATAWRTPTVYENEWRREAQQPANRIQFGYDSAYEEMRVREGTYGSGSGGIDHPKNRQLRISF